MNSTNAEGTSASDVEEWQEGTTIPSGVRAAFAELDGPIETRMLSSGLIHRTLHVRGQDGEYVLQRVSNVFSPAIHENIQAVTRHLTARGVQTFELLPTRTNELFVDVSGEGRWRMLTHLAGVCFQSVASEAQARSAGLLVGHFHAALDDFTTPLSPMGIPMRNTPLYLERLHKAIDDAPDHRLGNEVRSMTARIEGALAELGKPIERPDRVIHGDLKLANFLFEGADPPERDRATALIDLDTLIRAPLWSEWGDAWRSWCNTGEEAGFDLRIFEASLGGYLEGCGRRLSAGDKVAFATATERITLELCARFATDMLEESYFAWDSTLYDSAGEHNAARVRDQLAFFEATEACRAEREKILTDLP